ncbi:hypothetical protein [Hydrogenophaga sp. R2]|uniref:hypothetical protein n=1 Tax=Hydrogenophaga sp. R2 TaxID=3132827 RepID=UPI003CF519F2
MIQISTTAPASWPGANTPLTGPARPVAVVTPVAPVGPVASARADEEARRRVPGDAGTDAAASPPDGSVATTLADTQAKAEQQKADQEALEAREQADREAIERLRQALVDAWDASAAVVEQALAEKDPTASGGGSRAAALYDAAALDPAAGQTGQIISRRV